MLNIAGSSGALQVAHVNLEHVNYMSPFHAAPCPDGLALCTSEALVLGTIDALQRLHTRSVPLGMQVKPPLLHVHLVLASSTPPSSSSSSSFSLSSSSFSSSSSSSSSSLSTCLVFISLTFFFLPRIHFLLLFVRVCVLSPGGWPIKRSPKPSWSRQYNISPPSNTKTCSSPTGLPHYNMNPQAPRLLLRQAAAVAEKRPRSPPWLRNPQWS